MGRMGADRWRSAGSMMTKSVVTIANPSTRTWWISNITHVIMEAIETYLRVHKSELVLLLLLQSQVKSLRCKECDATTAARLFT